MLIPHLHFCGDCEKAIALYERAFGTKAQAVVRNREYAQDARADGAQIAHAVMRIHGQTVFLNDRFGNRNQSTDCAMNPVLVFKTAGELLACYEVMRPGSSTVDPLGEAPYSELVVQFLDQFGVQWAFMVGEEGI